MHSTGRLLCLVAMSVFWVGVARGDDVIESVMDRDPIIVLPKTEPSFAPGLLDLWLAALERPEVEMRTSAATAIAAAQRRGMTGLTVAVEPLRKALDKGEPHPNVRLAVATALVALDAKVAADSLLKASESSAELREVIYPALARWDHAPARSVWMGRLDKPFPYSRSHILAVRSLAVVREAKAIPRLRELLFAADITPPMRLEVARSLSVLSPSGLEADARRCTADLLVAATLLRHHSGNDAVRLLQGFATSDATSVAGVAVARLLEVDPKLGLPGVDSVLANRDAETRRLGVEVLFRLPATEHVAKLGRMLADAHPLVRNHARRALVGYAATLPLRPAVEMQIAKSLDAPDWRGQEQASLLAGQLKHRPVGERLVVHLSSKRAEVFIAAAWAVRELAVTETLPAVHEHVKLRHKQMLASGSTAGMENVTADQLDRHLSQLVQFLGQTKYKPADAALRALVPRFVRAGRPPGFTPVGGETRAAAIWAISKHYTDRLDEPLAEELLERLTGDGAMGSDDERVRRMVPIALTRMKAAATLTVLRQFSQEDKATLEPSAHACRWAVSQLNRKPLPLPDPVAVPQTDWFLVPYK